MDISSLRTRKTDYSMGVGELNQYIKNMFDDNRMLNAISVRGEISNFVNHRSGHLYFSLKDSEGQIRAVMFRSSAQSLKFMPENGTKVIVRGTVSVYTKDGSYQIYVNSMQPDGIGALYLAYEQLKERLFNEGLFDESVKKSIPSYPERIGVITSPTGAAVRDIINVIGRRYPLATIYLYPSLVQGESAENSLIEGVRYFSDSKLVDTIIIGRGGGSIEDLWAFNSESLARTIYSCPIPIISAVGHETDFTICDFVCDLRAPTPSAAAELAVPDVREIAMNLDNLQARLDAALVGQIERYKDKLSHITSSPVMQNPLNIVEIHRENLDDVLALLDDVFENLCKKKRNDLAFLVGKAEAMNPLAVLARGFSVVSYNGTAVTDANDLTVSDTVDIRMSRGSLKAKVIECEKSV